MSILRVAAFGDLVGEGGVRFFEKSLPRFRKDYRPDVVIVNGENSAKSNGIDPFTAQILRNCGVDVITSGNHVFRQYAIRSFLDDCSYLIRPANYPSCVPGMGYTTVDTHAGRLLVINVLGCAFMEPLASPFETVEAILKKEEGKYDLAMLDVHAEATSEKAALAHCFDGRIHGVFGTHTHVQTSDARILKKKTGFITDLGMCGPVDSILGVESEIILEKYRTKLPAVFRTAMGKCALEGAVFTLETGVGCTEVQAFRILEP